MDRAKQRSVTVWRLVVELGENAYRQTNALAANARAPVDER
jgi:hypothetical protein